LIRKVLIVEPSDGGHHFVFLKATIEALSIPDVELWLSCTRPMWNHLKTDFPHLHWIDHSLWKSKCVLEDIAQCVESLQIDHVYHANCDAFMSGLLRKMSLWYRPPRILQHKISGLYIRPRPLDARQPWTLKHWGAKFLFNKDAYFKKIFVFDETLAEHLLHEQTIVTLPDPPLHVNTTHDPDVARQVWGIPKHKRVFLQYGLGTPRKGLLTVIEAFEQLHSNDDHLLCVGKCDLSEKWNTRLFQLVADKKATVVDRYVDHLEESMAFSASDVVLLDYENHYGSSNVMALAASYRKPIIACEDGLIGQRVLAFGLGVRVKSKNVSALVRAILSGEKIRLDQSGASRYLDTHSIFNFKIIIKSEILN